MSLFRRSVTPRTNVYVTRDSVAAGDDGDAPHAMELQIAEPVSLESAVAAILSARYLPSISGGFATWSVASGIPLAVVAQQWPAPRWLFLTQSHLAALDRPEGVLHLQFNYHAQQDPELVLQVLEHLQLRAR